MIRAIPLIAAMSLGAHAAAQESEWQISTDEDGAQLTYTIPDSPPTAIAFFCLGDRFPPEFFQGDAPRAIRFVEADYFAFVDVGLAEHIAVDYFTDNLSEIQGWAQSIAGGAGFGIIIAGPSASAGGQFEGAVGGSSGIRVNDFSIRVPGAGFGERWDTFVNHCESL